MDDRKLRSQLRNVPALELQARNDLCVSSCSHDVSSGGLVWPTEDNFHMASSLTGSLPIADNFELFKRTRMLPRPRVVHHTASSPTGQ